MLFRIDTFTLPKQARKEFTEISERTIELLQVQPGYVRHQWFEKVSGAGAIDVVTIVHWQDAHSIDVAAKAVRALHAEAGFDAAEFARKHGIVESKAVYAEQSVGGSHAMTKL